MCEPKKKEFSVQVRIIFNQTIDYVMLERRDVSVLLWRQLHVQNRFSSVDDKMSHLWASAVVDCVNKLGQRFVGIVCL